jgi:hypothetical protein
MTRLILINGGHRTGSTLTYNIVREMCLLNHLRVNVIQTSNTKRRDFEDYDVEISKCHNYVPRIRKANVDAIFNFRNPHDSVASWVMYLKAGGLNPKLLSDGLIDIDKIIESVRQDQKAVKRARESYSLLIGYYSLFTDMDGCIQNISAHLGIPADARIKREISRRLERYTVNQELEADPVTQLRKHHVSVNGGRPGSFFSLDQLTQEKVNQVFGQYINY